MKYLYLGFIGLLASVSLASAESNERAGKISTLQQYLKDYENALSALPSKPFDTRRTDELARIEAGLTEGRLDTVVDIISAAEKNVFQDKGSVREDLIRLRESISKLMKVKSKEEGDGLLPELQKAFYSFSAGVLKEQTQSIQAEYEKKLIVRNKQMLQRVLKYVNENLPEDSEDQPNAVRRVFLNQKSGKTYEFVLIIPSDAELSGNKLSSNTPR